MAPGAPVVGGLRRLTPAAIGARIDRPGSPLRAGRSMRLLAGLLNRGGLVVTTPPEAKENQPIYFETTVQLDGDVITRVREELLKEPAEFHRRLAEHSRALSDLFHDLDRLAAVMGLLRGGAWGVSLVSGGYSVSSTGYATYAGWAQFATLWEVPSSLLFHLPPVFGPASVVFGGAAWGSRWLFRFYLKRQIRRLHLGTPRQRR